MANYIQQVFRFYNDDGSESAATAYAAQDTNINPVVSGNLNITLRIAVANTTGGAIATRDWQLQYSKNSGSYTNVTTSSSNVKAFDSSNLTDQGATTNRLTGASGTFQAGGIAETGNYDAAGDLYSISNGRFTEFLYTLTIIDADVSNADTLDFRVSSLNSYTVTPRITVAKSLSYNYNASGSLLAVGLSVQQTGGVFFPVGKLIGGGEASSSSQGNPSDFFHDASGGINSPTASQGGSPTLGLTFVVGGGINSPASTQGGSPYVTGVFNGVGGSLGGVGANEAGTGQQGFTFDAEGSIGSPQSDSGEDVEIVEYFVPDDDHTRTESFVPCCVVPPRTQTTCCNCSSEVWDYWKIEEPPAFFDGTCSVELTGFTYQVTNGCGLSASGNLGVLAPALQYTPPPAGYCGQWISYPFSPAGGGIETWVSSDYKGCCYPDLSPSTQCQKNVYWHMGCVPASSATYVPALTHWEGVGPYCVGCADGLYCGPAPDCLIEFGSLEDCEAEYGVGNCRCSGEEEPVHHISQEECEYYGCTSCVEVEDYPAVYTPPFPAVWYLGWNGPCGCTMVFLSTTSDHPIYGFYEPTSGLDQQDACGNFYYRHFGAYDATGPFDCTSGGTFVLANCIQPAFLGGDCSYPIPPENLPTNLFDGYDAPCAVGWLSGGTCGYGCGREAPTYVTVRPLSNLRQLPRSGWISPDDNGNMLCCTSTADADTSVDGMGMALSFAQTLNTLPPFTPTQNLKFRFKHWTGEFQHIGSHRWMVNYPPLRFEIIKEGDRYVIVDGYTKGQVLCDVILEEPLILSAMVGNELMEINGN